MLGAWLVALAILPGSTRPYLDRLSGSPFIDWLTPQLGFADALGLVLLVLFGWYAARSPAVA